MSDDGVVGWSTADLHHWHVLRPLLDGRPYLPWSDGAMRPGGIVATCNEIVIRGHRSVVELGSGVSTIVLARLLAGRGGRVVSLEHDPLWLEWVTTAIAAEGLGEVATVLHAPLDHGNGWYASSAVDLLPVCDVLIVDGPPAFEAGRELARAPALPGLLHLVRPGGAIVLDDVIRPGEQEVLRRWEADTPLRFKRDEQAAVALARVPAASSG